MSFKGKHQCRALSHSLSPSHTLTHTGVLTYKGCFTHAKTRTCEPGAGTASRRRHQLFDNLNDLHGQLKAESRAEYVAELAAEAGNIGMGRRKVVHRSPRASLLSYKDQDISHTHTHHTRLYSPSLSVCSLSTYFLHPILNPCGEKFSSSVSSRPPEFCHT